MIASITFLRATIVATAAFSVGSWAATAHSLHARHVTMQHLIQQVDGLRDAQRALSAATDEITLRVSAMEDSAARFGGGTGWSVPKTPNTGCEPRRLSPGEVRRSASPGTTGTCIGVGGAVRMSFVLEQSFSWGLCSFTLPGIHDLLDAGAILEVRYCAATPIPGMFNLWIGHFPSRQFASLSLGGNKTPIPAGCYAKRLGRNEWCFLSHHYPPKDCDNQCGRLPQCPIDGDELGLAVEGLSEAAHVEVEVTDFIVHSTTTGCP